MVLKSFHYQVMILRYPLFPQVIVIDYYKIYKGDLII